jgi:quercetin dioxygenase-like cupin family protein
MGELKDLSNSIIFPKGEKADSRFFIGDAWSSVLVVDEGEFNCPAWNVTFAPGARNNWHKHAGGQILLVTGGKGWYQEAGSPARLLRPGDVVMIPAGVKHWHGADADNWLVHIAICPNPQKGGAEWMEPVSDEDYGKLKNK